MAKLIGPVSIRQAKAKSIFGRSARRGRVYRHGVAAAMGGEIPLAWHLMSRMATQFDRRATAGSDDWGSGASAEPVQRADQWVADWLDESEWRHDWTPLESARAVMFAAALPSLHDQIESERWSRLVETLVHLHEQASSSGAPDAAATIMLGAELGLTLAWRLDARPREQWIGASVQVMERWVEHFQSAQSESLSHGGELRLILASLARTEQLIMSLPVSRDLHSKSEEKQSSKKRSQKKPVQAAEADEADPTFSACIHDLVVWAVGLTGRDGWPVFHRPGDTAIGPADLANASRSGPTDVSQWETDVSHWEQDDFGDGGLFERLTAYDPESLGPAIAAARGQTQSGGRLAWQVSLPESMLHDEDAGIAILMPDWDVRRGRLNIDYSDDSIECELVAGRRLALQGKWKTRVSVDGVAQHSEGDWTLSCEYSDDDVHFVEVEQPWSNGWVLQRQFMTLRDDRAAMIADAWVPIEQTADRWARPVSDHSRRITHQVDIPIGETLRVEGEPETREVFLVDHRRQAMIVPLSAGEWRDSASPTTLEYESGHLQWTNQARGRLYAPLWCDLLRRRFKRPRTWRTLTVADQLEICPADAARAFRMQAGSSQWVIYRSLAGQRLRTFLGKHVMADFIASRFDPTDGVHEELVTVEADD